MTIQPKQRPKKRRQHPPPPVKIPAPSKRGKRRRREEEGDDLQAQIRPRFRAASAQSYVHSTERSSQTAKGPMMSRSLQCRLARVPQVMAATTTTSLIRPKMHSSTEPMAQALVRFSNHILVFNSFHCIFFILGPLLSAPVEAALSEMMRTQLTMTEQFLKSQRSLYENYCASLSRVAVARESRAKVR